ncbi:HNH endonuclease [Enterobacter hormaechei]
MIKYINSSALKKEDYHEALNNNRYIRHHLWEMTNRRCSYCGIPLKEQDGNIDHIHPSSKNGSDSIANLRVVCKSCNSSKGNKLLEEWRLVLRWRKKYPTSNASFKEIKASTEKLPEYKFYSERMRKVKYLYLNGIQIVSSLLPTHPILKPKIIPPLKWESFDMLAEWAHYENYISDKWPCAYY